MAVDEIGITLRMGALSDFAAQDVIGQFVHAWMTPFQLPAWREQWHRSPGSCRSIAPATAILTWSGHPFALLPLAAHRTSGLRVLTWQAGEDSDYGAPVIARDRIELFCTLDGEQMMRRVAAALGNVDLVYLPKQPATIDGHGNPLILKGAVPHHVGAHAITFTSGESWEDFLIRRRSASTRQQLRKKQRNLGKLGKVAFRLAAVPDDARAIIEHCLAAKSRQLAQLGHHDPFASPNVRSFLTEYFTTGVGRETWAVALTLDGAPLATSFGFIHGDEWLLYQMAMDAERAEHCSPGTQLLMDIMRHCIGTGIRRLDLAMGDERYKYEWCDEHQVLSTSCLPLSGRGHMAAMLIMTKARVLKRMAAHPQLYDFGKSMKRRLLRLRPRA